MSKPKTGSAGIGFIKNVAVSGAIGFLLSVVLLLLAALIMSSGKAGLSSGSGIVCAAVFVGSLVSAYTAGRRAEKSRLLTGIVTSLVTLLIICLAGMCWDSAGQGALALTQTAISAVAGGLFGGLLAASGRKIKRRP